MTVPPSSRVRGATVECPEHGPFAVAPTYAELFRDGECFEVQCPVVDGDGNPHFIPARLAGGKVVNRESSVNA